MTLALVSWLASGRVAYISTDKKASHGIICINYRVCVTGISAQKRRLKAQQTRPITREQRAEMKQRKYRYLYQVRTAHGDVISQVCDQRNCYLPITYFTANASILTQLHTEVRKRWLILQSTIA